MCYAQRTVPEGCAFLAGPGEQVGTAWDPHDPALLFTEGRLLHG